MIRLIAKAINLARLEQKYVRKKHSEWTKLGIYEHVYKNSLGKYL